MVFKRLSVSCRLSVVGCQLALGKRFDGVIKHLLGSNNNLRISSPN
jgi:hypothetical protein